MGQYHKVVNLTKFEYLNPHKLGLGLKAVEQCYPDGSTAQLLFALTMCSNGRGGGDFDDNDIIGRWAGDRIAVIGDYVAGADLPDQFDVGSIWERFNETNSPLIKLAECADGVDEQHYGQDPATAIYRDISDLCIPFLEQAFGIRVQMNSHGWRDRVRVRQG